MDKKDHYVKRAVAVGGDTLQIINGQIYINGKIEPQAENVQFLHTVQGNVSGINPIKRKEWGLTRDNSYRQSSNNIFYLSTDKAKTIAASNPSVQVQQVEHKSDAGRLFPHDPVHYPDWSVDNYGPIYIPKKGATVSLSKSNIELYKKVISDYEHNELSIQGEEIKINGSLASTYTFKQDYYWAMGDNRHNSEDSRMWGFVPHDHIVGRPLVIWFSSKNGIRWSRIFKSARNI